MRRLMIYHHLGLGDHIICNGLVRKRCTQYDEVSLICKTRNVVSVACMFSDLVDKLKIIAVHDDVEATNIFNRANYEREGIGYMGAGWNERDKRSFDVQFYSQANLPLSCRWDNFGMMRDERDEINLSVSLKLPGQFVFVHDDSTRELNIDSAKIKSMLPRIRPNKFTENICDYAAILEKAAEIHCINSAFLLMADSLPHIKADLYFHKYARDDGLISIPKLKQNWRIAE